MNWIIQDTLDSRLEARCILQRLTGSGDEDHYEYIAIRQDCRNFARRQQIREEEAGAMFAPLRQIYEAVTARLGAARDDIQYYFSMLRPQPVSLAQIDCMDQRLAERLPGERDKARVFAFVEAITGGNAVYESLPGAGAGEFAAWLGKQELDEQSRWRILDFYLHIERHAPIIRRILDEAQALFEIHAGLADDMVRRCVNRLREHGSTVLNEDLIRGFDACVIVPQLFAYASLHVWGEGLPPAGQDPDAPTLVHYGVLVDEISDLRAGQTSCPDALLRALRGLSDKTRLQILAALRNRPMFGYELAELTGLSAATVSHHMNELFNRDFIVMERQGTSLRYSLRGDALERLLADLRELLL